MNKSTLFYRMIAYLICISIVFSESAIQSMAAEIGSDALIAEESMEIEAESEAVSEEIDDIDEDTESSELSSTFDTGSVEETEATEETEVTTDTGSVEETEVIEETNSVEETEVTTDTGSVEETKIMEETDTTQETETVDVCEAIQTESSDASGDYIGKPWEYETICDYIDDTRYCDDSYKNSKYTFYMGLHLEIQQLFDKGYKFELTLQYRPLNENKWYSKTGIHSKEYSPTYEYVFEDVPYFMDGSVTLRVYDNDFFIAEHKICDGLSFSGKNKDFEIELRPELEEVYSTSALFNYSINDRFINWRYGEKLVEIYMSEYDKESDSYGDYKVVASSRFSETNVGSERSINVMGLKENTKYKCFLVLSYDGVKTTCARPEKDEFTTCTYTDLSVSVASQNTDLYKAEITVELSESMRLEDVTGFIRKKGTYEWTQSTNVKKNGKKFTITYDKLDSCTTYEWKVKCDKQEFSDGKLSLDESANKYLTVITSGKISNAEIENAKKLIGSKVYLINYGKGFTDIPIDDNSYWHWEESQFENIVIHEDNEIRYFKADYYKNNEVVYTYDCPVLACQIVDMAISNGMYVAAGEEKSFDLKSILVGCSLEDKAVANYFDENITTDITVLAANDNVTATKGDTKDSIKIKANENAPSEAVQFKIRLMHKDNIELFSKDFTVNIIGSDGVVNNRPTISAQKVSMNKYKISGEEIGYVERYDNRIEKVEIYEGEALSENFIMTKKSEDKLCLEFKENAPAREIEKKKVYKCSLKVYTDKSNTPYVTKLTITVNVTKPVAQIKQTQKFNLFDAGSKAKYSITSNYKISKVDYEEHNGNEREYYSIDSYEEGVLWVSAPNLDSKTRVFYMQNPASISFDIEFDDYTYVQSVDIKVKTECKKYNIKLAPFKVDMAEFCDGNDYAEFEGTVKVTGLPNNYEYIETITSTDNVNMVLEDSSNAIVWMNSGPRVKSKYKVVFRCDTWASDIVVTGSVKKYNSNTESNKLKKAKVSLATNKICLPVNKTDKVYSIPVTVKGYEDAHVYDMEFVGDDYDSLAVYDDVLRMSYDDEKEVVNISLTEAAANMDESEYGKFKIAIIPYIGTQDFSAESKKIYLEVTICDPVIFTSIEIISTKGYINIKEKATSQIVYTTKVKHGYNHKVTRIRVLEGGENFDVSVLDDGKISVKAKSGVKLSTKETYEILCHVNTTDGFGFRLFKVKPISKNPKVSVSTSKGSLYKGTGNFLEVNLRISDSDNGYKNIQKIVGNTKNKNNKYFNVIYDKHTAKVKIGLSAAGEKLKPGKYTVKYDIYCNGAGSKDKPITKSVVITVK